jgi:hypothetical protein
MTIRSTVCVAACLAASAISCAAAAAPASRTATRLHAAAVDSFREGRFAEAYGRFAALADAGHGPAARYALWMCEHGRALFGSDWDCGPDQLVEWSRAAGVAIPDVPTKALVPAAALR